MMLKNAYHTGSYVNNVLSLEFFSGSMTKKNEQSFTFKKLVITYLLEMYSLYIVHHMFWNTFIPLLNTEYKSYFIFYFYVLLLFYSMYY